MGLADWARGITDKKTVFTERGVYGFLQLLHEKIMFPVNFAVVFVLPAQLIAWAAFPPTSISPSWFSYPGHFWLFWWDGHGWYALSSCFIVLQLFRSGKKIIQPRRTWTVSTDFESLGRKLNTLEAYRSFSPLLQGQNFWLEERMWEMNILLLAWYQRIGCGLLESP